MIDEIAEFRDDGLNRLVVNLRDETQVDAAFLVKRGKEPCFGGGDSINGRLPPHHVLAKDGCLGCLTCDLVVILQRHDKHCVRILTKADEIWHAADDRAISGFTEGGFVDRPVGGDKLVVDAVERLACVTTLHFRPAFILRLQDKSCGIAELNEGGESPSHHRAVGGELSFPMGDRFSDAVHYLVDTLIIANKETAFMDMPFWRRTTKRCSMRRIGRQLLFGLRSRQVFNSFIQECFEVAMASDAVASITIELAFACPGAEDHFWVVMEIAVDGNFAAFDGKRLGGDPVWISVIWLCTRSSFPQKDNVSNDLGAFLLESVRRQANRPEKVRLLGQIFPNGSILFVERKVRRDQCEHAARFECIDRFGEEIVVQ